MFDEASQDRVFVQLSLADEALSRLDERLGACPWRGGYLARRDFAEAVAWSWTQGVVTPMEDLVLHDQSMDLRVPDGGLLATHALVRARRKAATGGVELLQPGGVDWLTGRRAKPPAVGGFVTVRATTAIGAVGRPGMIERLSSVLTDLERGDASEPAAGVSEWLDVASRLDGDIPPVLRAAALLEAWWIIDPLPRQRYIGGLLVGLWLQVTRRIASHLVGFETGLRAVTRSGREVRAGAMPRRLAFWLSVMTRSAEEGVAELQRLEVTRQAMSRHVAGRRAHARAGDVMELLLTSPVVTAPMIAERLGVSQQSARRSLDELGSVVVEISGRSRFRAWRV